MVIMVIATRDIDSLKKQSSQWTGKLYQTILKHLETNNGSDLLLISFDRLLKHFPSAAKPVKESAMDLMLKKFAQSNYNPHILTVIVSLFVVETKSSEDSLVDGIVASIYMILNDAFELNSPAELYRKKLSIEISKSNWRQELRKLFQLLESIIQSNTKITIDPVLALLKFIYSLKFTQMEYNDFLLSVNDISDRFLIALVKCVGSNFILKKTIKSLVKIMGQRRYYSKCLYYELLSQLLQVNYFESKEEIDVISEAIQEEISFYHSDLPVLLSSLKDTSSPELLKFAYAIRIIRFSIEMFSFKLNDDVIGVLVSIALNISTYSYTSTDFPTMLHEMTIDTLRSLYAQSLEDRSLFPVIVKIVSTGIHHSNKVIRDCSFEISRNLTVVVKPKVQPVVLGVPSFEEKRKNSAYVEKAIAKKVKVDDNIDQHLPLQSGINATRKTTITKQQQDSPKTIPVEVSTNAKIPEELPAHTQEKSVLNLPKIQVQEHKDHLPNVNQVDHQDSQIVPMKRLHDETQNSPENESDGDSNFPEIEIDYIDSDNE